MASLAEVLDRGDLSPVRPGGPGPRKLSPAQFAVARQPFAIRESWQKHVPTVPVWRRRHPTRTLDCDDQTTAWQRCSRPRRKPQPAGATTRLLAGLPAIACAVDEL